MEKEDLEICECGHTKEDHTIDNELSVCCAHINPVNAGGIIIEECCPCKKFRPKRKEESS